VLVGVPVALLRAAGAAAGGLGELGLGVANSVVPGRARDAADRWRKQP
jgi:hypothetical protein